MWMAFLLRCIINTKIKFRRPGLTFIFLVVDPGFAVSLSGWFGVIYNSTRVGRCLTETAEMRLVKRHIYISTIAASKIKGTASEIYRIFPCNGDFPRIPTGCAYRGNPCEYTPLLAYTTRAQSWPHDGVWPTFQKKTGRDRIKLRGQPYQSHSGTSSFIDHLSRDTSGFICGLIGICELCYLDYELC